MSKARVLIVDDHPAQLKLTQIILEGEGYEIQTASDGPEVFRALEEFSPSLILMDIKLPGLDGLELTRLIKNLPEGRHIPILALTACAMKGDDEKAFAAGCVGYITKPLDPEDFVKIIAKYIGNP